jgi:hypothetical protein
MDRAKRWLVKPQGPHLSDIVKFPLHEADPHLMPVSVCLTTIYPQAFEAIRLEGQRRRGMLLVTAQYGTAAESLQAETGPQAVHAENLGEDLVLEEDRKGAVFGYGT